MICEVGHLNEAIEAVSEAAFDDTNLGRSRVSAPSQISSKTKVIN